MGFFTFFLVERAKEKKNFHVIKLWLNHDFSQFFICNSNEFLIVCIKILDPSNGLCNK